MCPQAKKAIDLLYDRQALQRYLAAADAPGVPDILEGGEASGGLVVPRGDAMALATALGRVLDNQAWRHELGKLARCRALECFSLEAIGQQLRDFLFNPRV